MPSGSGADVAEEPGALVEEHAERLLFAARASCCVRWRRAIVRRCHDSRRGIPRRPGRRGRSRSARHRSRAAHERRDAATTPDRRRATFVARGEQRITPGSSPAGRTGVTRIVPGSASPSGAPGSAVRPRPFARTSTSVSATPARERSSLQDEGIAGGQRIDRRASCPSGRAKRFTSLPPTTDRKPLSLPMKANMSGLGGIFDFALPFLVGDDVVERRHRDVEAACRPVPASGRSSSACR